MFHHPAWAVGSYYVEQKNGVRGCTAQFFCTAQYSSGPPAGELPKSRSTKSCARPPGSRCTYFAPQFRSHLDTDEGDDEGDDIAEHVEGVGHEGHRVGHVARDDLDEEEDARQADHGEEAALLARVAPHGDGGDWASCNKYIIYRVTHQVGSNLLLSLI